MTELVSKMKNLFTKSNNEELNSEPAFFLETKILYGMLPFSNTSIEIEAFSDKSKLQRLVNVNFKWFRKIEGKNY